MQLLDWTQSILIRDVHAGMICIDPLYRGTIPPFPYLTPTPDNQTVN